MMDPELIALLKKCHTAVAAARSDLQIGILDKEDDYSAAADEIVVGGLIDLEGKIEKLLARPAYEKYKAECYDNGDEPCADIHGHKWVVSDEDENHCYCSKCGCAEY